MVNVRALRQAQNLSQADLSRATGVSQQIISMIETGYRPASVQVAQALAPVLGVDWPEFFNKKEE